MHDPSLPFIIGLIVVLISLAVMWPRSKELPSINLRLTQTGIQGEEWKARPEHQEVTWAKARKQGYVMICRSSRRPEQLADHLNRDLGQLLQTVPPDLSIIEDSVDRYIPQSPVNGSYDGWISVKIRPLSAA